MHERARRRHRKWLLRALGPVVCFGLAAGFFYEAYRDYRIAAWSSGLGKVLATGPVSFKESGRRAVPSSSEVTFSYSANGKIYFGSGTVSARESATMGGSIPIWYDPDHPKNVVTSAPGRLLRFVFLFLGSIFALVGAQELRKGSRYHDQNLRPDPHRPRRS